MSIQENMQKRKQQALLYDEAIGDAVASVRYDQRLRQGDVAEAFGCEQPLISKLEAGQRSLKFCEIHALASALNISVDELVDRLLSAIKKADAE